MKKTRTRLWSLLLTVAMLLTLLPATALAEDTEGYTMDLWDYWTELDEVAANIPADDMDADQILAPTADVYYNNSESPIEYSITERNWTVTYKAPGSDAFVSAGSACTTGSNGNYVTLHLAQMNLTAGVYTFRVTLNLKGTDTTNENAAFEVTGSLDYTLNVLPAPPDIVTLDIELNNGQPFVIDYATVGQKMVYIPVVVRNQNDEDVTGFCTVTAKLEGGKLQEWDLTKTEDGGYAWKFYPYESDVLTDSWVKMSAIYTNENDSRINSPVETLNFTVSNSNVIADVSLTDKEGNVSYYAYLKSAIAAADAGDTVTILKNYKLSSIQEEKELTLNKSLVLDLGGHTIDFDGGRLNLTKGILTVRNGVVDNAGQAFNVYGNVQTSNVEYAKLIIAQDATIKADYGICLFPAMDSNTVGYGASIDIYGKIEEGGIFVSGNLGNNDDMLVEGNIPTITIHDGAVVKEGSEGQGIAMNGLAKVIVEDGAYISGNEAIGVKRGFLTVYGGEFVSDGEKIDPAQANNNGTEKTGATISITSTYNYAGIIDVQILGGEFRSENAPAVYLGHSAKNGTANTYKKGVTLRIKGGHFTSPAGVNSVYVANVIEDDVAYTQKVITGGYFSDRPLDNYIATGYTALPSDKSGYDWMVVQEGSNPAGVAVGWSHMSNNVDKDASDMESKAAGELLHEMIGSDLIQYDLSDYAKILANRNTVTAEQGKAALEDAGISTEGEAVSIYIMPETRVIISDVVLAEGSTMEDLKVEAFTMSFAVDYYTVATTAEDDSGILLPEFASADAEVNAVTVGDPQAWPAQQTEITIPLDEIFQVPADNTRYIHDLNGTSVYVGSVSNGELTFTATEGLSTFVIAPTEDWNTDTHAVRYVVEDVAYPTEVERVPHGEKITFIPTRDGYAFLGWYTDPELTEAWNMAKDTVTENITLYAKWAAVKPPEGVDKIEVSTGDAVIDEDVPAGAEDILEALTGNNGVDQAGEGITDAAKDVAASEITDAVVEEAKEKLKVGSGITIVVETYLDVKVTEAAEDSFTLDITPMYQLKASANGSDPVIIGTAKELTVTGSVTLTVPLPSGFAEAVEKLFVRHLQYVYEGMVDGSLLTFLNPHGFSEFTVTREAPVAKIEGESYGYADLQDAIDAVEDGQTIIVYASDLSAEVSGNMAFYIELGNEEIKYPILTAADGYELTTSTAEGLLRVAVWPERGTSTGSGSSGGTAPVRDITVDSGSHGDVEVWPEEAKQGTTVTITATPDKGYEVADVTVTAENGKEITVTDKGNNKYTFTMPNSDVTIEVTFQPVSESAASGGDLTITAPAGWVNPYTDVAASDWFYNAVGYATANGLMGGVGNNAFDPSGTMNRAMVWTVIARLAGQTISGANWADDARTWAMAQGVSDGTNPDGAVSREELVTMLYRYAGSPEMNVPELALIGNYPDSADVSGWAESAFAWAISKGIIEGRDGKLAAGDSITRAEAATILARFHLLTK